MMSVFVKKCHQSIKLLGECGELVSVVHPINQKCRAVHYTGLACG